MRLEDLRHLSGPNVFTGKPVSLARIELDGRLAYDADASGARSGKPATALSGPPGDTTLGTPGDTTLGTPGDTTLGTPGDEQANSESPARAAVAAEFPTRGAATPDAVAQSAPTAAAGLSAWSAPAGASQLSDSTAGEVAARAGATPRAGAPVAVPPATVMSALAAAAEQLVPQLTAAAERVAPPAALDTRATSAAGPLRRADRPGQWNRGHR